MAKKKKSAPLFLAILRAAIENRLLIPIRRRSIAAFPDVGNLAVGDWSNEKFSITGVTCRAHAMNRRPLSLIEILEPKIIPPTPERARVTRTIVQPEIDAFEEMEAALAKAAAKGQRPVAKAKEAMAEA